MYGADLVWMERLHGITLTRADVILPETLSDLEKRWLALIAEWKAFAASLSDSQWSDKLEYTMFDGSRRCNTLWQIVMHVVNHGTLHGGQVVTMLRQSGVTPPQTDLIFFYREMEAAAAA
jgi:uncharacterized damage-inducible protein DinB